VDDDLVALVRRECNCQFLSWKECPCLACRAADDIERLRAETNLLQAKVDYWRGGVDIERARADDLQALIDAYAAAWLERVHAYAAREWGHGTDERCTAADMALDAADDALRAVATPKEDDRGPR